MWLAADKNGNVEVGVEGWYPALRQVLDEYRTDAITYTPHDLAPTSQGAVSDRRGMLIMTFSAEGLKRAAAKAASLTAHSGLNKAPTTTAGGSQ
jgi:hypothetical protein